MEKGTQKVARKILDSAVQRAIHLAHEIKTHIEDLYVRELDTEFEDFAHALNTVAGPSRLDGFRKSVDAVRGEIALASLMLFGPVSKSESVDTQLLASTERQIVLISEKLKAKYAHPFAKLASAVDPGKLQIRSTAVKVTAAKDWLGKNREAVQAFIHEAETVVASIRAAFARTAIIRSLAFPEVHARYHKISRAQAKTFEWIYETDDGTESLSNSLANWLRSDDPELKSLFWVSGKPGSGKSTLMRFLSDNPKTLIQAQDWAGSSDLVVTKTFFWNPGTRLQKSQQGLLQSILLQLLRQRPEFPSAICRHYWALLELEPSRSSNWTLSELRDGILHFADYFGNDTKILLLVDGLDEYHAEDKHHDSEERQAVCSLLCQLAAKPNIKVCASSRPWQIYRDALGMYPMLRLEDLTRNDIPEFILARFHTSNRFTLWVSTDPDASRSFVEQLVSRAQGVFLWVCLVVRSLLEGLQNHNNLNDLGRRLDEIPSDLEEYFHRIISTLNPFYLEQASQMFAIAVKNRHLLMHYYFINWTNMLPGDTEYDLERVIVCQQEEEKRINVRCMGLLEAIDARALDDSYQLGVQYVDFMHRSARDFMMRDDMQRRLASWRNSDFDTDITLVQGIVRLVRSCCHGAPWLDGHIQSSLIKSALDYAEDAHSRGRSVGGLLDILKADVDHYSRVDRPRGFFLALVLERNHFYALDFMQGRTNLPPQADRPWLDHAVNGSRPSVHKPAIIKRLLELGSDPNEIYLGQTVWGRFLDGALTRGGLQGTVGSEFETAVLLIKHGAVSTVPAGYNNHPHQPRTSSFLRTPDPYRALRQIFPPDEAQELVKLLNQNAEGHWKTRVMKFFSY